MNRVQTIVIGAGQAGLSVGYHLAQRGVSFVILEARERIGDVWRERWDSLRLFTSARFNGLAGMPFPAGRNVFPTKDQMADYLEQYAERFGLRVYRGIPVDRLWRDGDRYIVTAKRIRFEAEHVVVAMASYQRPSVPIMARRLDAGILQLHSSEYRNPGQLQAGDTLVVGAGNSGAEIALELARAGHRTWLSGRDTGHVPFRPSGRIGQLFMNWFVLRIVFHRLKKRRPSDVKKSGPLIRVHPKDLAEAGVERVAKTVDVSQGQPVIAGGRRLDVRNVVWCTGFEPGFSWIELPVFGGDGEPIHHRGIVTGEPGLYFVGLKFLYTLSSSMIHGVDRDAAHIAETIGRRVGSIPVPSGSPALQSAWW